MELDIDTAENIPGKHFYLLSCTSVFNNCLLTNAFCSLNLYLHVVSN